MKTAILGLSMLEDERRVPIYPDDLPALSSDVLRQLVFEENYGKYFGVEDDYFREMTGNRCERREELFHNYRSFIIPKPVMADYEMMHEGSVCFGWIHSVQNCDVVDIALQKKLTLIAWENMFVQTNRGKVHVFAANNELAGYCSVNHALLSRGIDGFYGAAKKIVVLSYGSVGKGAIYALQRNGYHDITVLTWRNSIAVADRNPQVRYKQLLQEDDTVMVRDGNVTVTILSELMNADIVVNAILQDPNQPIMFLTEAECLSFTKELFVIDVSCDAGIGFDFARPTTFEQPIIALGKCLYYGINHSPTLLFDSASALISHALMEYLGQFVSQDYGAVLRNAIDIMHGYIVNEDIMTYQSRVRNEVSVSQSGMPKVVDIDERLL